MVEVELTTALILFLLAGMFETRLRVEKLYREVCPKHKKKKDLNTGDA